MNGTRLGGLAAVGCAAAMASVLLAADDAPKHSPAIQTAIDKRDAAVAKATAAYASTVGAADRQLIRDVENIQRRAMTSGDLTAANDATAVKADAASDARSKGPPAPVSTLSTLSGKWVMRDTSASAKHWEITPTEARNSNPSNVGVVSMEGPSMVIRWQKVGLVDRLVLMANGQVFKERWNVGNGQRYPQDPPEQLAIGDRE